MKTLAFQKRVYWLSYLGILPVMLATIMLWLDISRPLALDLLHNYAAVILTFVGAIHWGRSMQKSNIENITFSVLPSLYALICLLLPVGIALPMLIAGFVFLYLYDIRQYSVSFLWFKKIRKRLTFAFSGLLMINWISLPAYA